MFQLTVDKDLEIKVDARITVTTPKPLGAVRLTATMGGFSSTFVGAKEIMYTLPADKKVQLQIAYVDANGNPAEVDGEVSWSSSNPDIANVDPTTGEMVWLVPGTAIGNCQISATADADLGAGVRNLVTIMDVTVVGGEAVAGSITPVGEAVPKS